MEIINHITFSEEEAPKLVNYLKKNDIAFKDNGCFFIVDLSEQHPHWVNIQKIINKEEISCISETIFSTEELNEANWLRIRSCWRFDYPQPENDYESITYSKDIFCAKCGSGLIQYAPFRMKKEPKWGKRNFLMTNWVEDELFLSSQAKDLLESEMIPNITFQPVLNKKGSDILQGISQLMVEKLLPHGLIEKSSCIRQSYTCPYCKSIKYHPNGRGKFAFHKEVFYNMPPIVKSSDLIGWGKTSSRLIIINQDIFKLLKHNHMDSSLVFEPIQLI